MKGAAPWAPVCSLHYGIFSPRTPCAHLLVVPSMPHGTRPISVHSKLAPGYYKHDIFALATSQLEVVGE